MVDRHRQSESDLAVAYDESRKAQEKFGKVFMSAPVCIIVSELETGLVIDVNDEFLRRLGYSRDEIVGRFSADIGFWPEDAVREELVERLRLTGESYDDALELRANDGSVLTFRVAAHSIELEGRTLLVSTFVDITERQRAQQALRKSEEKYSNLFRSVPVGIVVSSVDEARVAEINDEFLRFLGFQRDEVVGRTTFELGVWPDPALREKLLSDVRADGDTRLEYPLRAKNGEIRMVRGASLFLEIDAKEFVLTAVIDVTEEYQAKVALERSEHLYRELFEGVRDVIVSIDPDGTLSALNPAFEHLTGWPRSRWLGQSFAGLIVEEDRQLAINLFETVLADQPRSVTQLRVRTADGNVRISETYLSVRRENGAVIGVLGIARDVTDRVQLEEEFRHAQKMEAVGRLAGGVAHDFNNLLTVINGYSDILMTQLDEGDPRRADVEEIADAGATAASLTRQLLAFSRRGVTHARVMSINEVVSSSVKLVKRLIGDDVQILTSLADDAGNVRIDGGQLEQIIMNLAVNARDAMPGGGKLTMATANVHLTGDYVSGIGDAPSGLYVMLSVTDTGTGMDDATKSRIFEPFFTTKGIGHGTGLGLATVFGIIKQSKGFIRVTSAPGGGTTFDIYLPRVVERASRQTPPGNDVPGGKETILVVEDEPAVRTIVRQMLERKGYTVLEAGGGSAALDIAVQHQGPIHLLLTDVVMLGMGGLEVARTFAETRPDTRTLFMSGYTGDNPMAREFFEQNSAFLQKPFGANDLGRMVRTILDATA
jgi:PAS domain S-box-containing protein